MSDNDQNMVPIPCAYGCGRPPVVGYELPGGQKINLCIEHWQQFEEHNARQIDFYRQQMEQLEDEMDDIVGLPRKVRPPRIPPARVNVHQVTIHGDNLGVVNTGTVGSIANSLTIIRAHNERLAEQLKNLTEAVLASNALDAVQKQEAADLLKEVVEDVAKPPEQRRSRAVMKTIASGLSQVLSHAADIYALWAAIEPNLP